MAGDGAVSFSLSFEGGGVDCEAVDKDSIAQGFEENFGEKPAVVSASPGRIEFIGNHTDYNGGEVLGVALDRSVVVAAGKRTDGRLVMRSGGRAAAYAGDLVYPLRREDGVASWANYPLGILAVLHEERGWAVEGGLSLYLESTVPEGAGLSSSAALELATLEVVLAVMGQTLSRREKVLLAQAAENRFVGVPCGILDQAVSCFGEADHLVRIDCATTEFSTVPMPEGLRFVVVNTNCKHSLVDSKYAERHAECCRALEKLQETEPGLEHLAKASLSSLDKLTDEPLLAARARHVVEENRRVAACVKALGSGDLERVGDLLFASHASSRDLFENSIPELDTLVELLGERRGDGVVGARLTGGGFGGAVMALLRGPLEAETLVADYCRRHPGAPEPSVIHVGSGAGTRLL